MNRNSALVGGIFIALGVVFLGAKMVFGYDIINLGPGDFWPLIILMLGLVFEGVYFASRSKPGFLVPGGILTTIGLLHMFEVSTDFRFAEYTWPIYIVSVAVGLYQLYIFGNRSRGVLIAASILLAIAAISLMSILFEIFTSVISVSYFIAFILIIAGLLLVFGRKRV